MTDVTPLKTPRNNTQLCDIYPLARGERHFFIFDLACGPKFLRVLIFAIFAIFPAIRKKIGSREQKLLQTFFSAEIYSRVNIL